MIVDLIERAKRNPSELVTFFSSADYDAVREPMEAARAAGIAKEWLVLKLWKPKIQEYIETARDNLAKHKPREALSALRRWESLPGLNDARIGLPLPDTLRSQINNVEKEIQSKLTLLEKAEELIQKANLEQDPVRAYELWEKAQQTFPYLPALPETKKTIAANAKSEIETLLTETQKGLEEEQWNRAKLRLDRIQKLLSLRLALPARLRDRYDELDQVYQAIRPLADRMSRKSLSLQQEIDLLESLQRTYSGSYWDHWDTWQRRLAELQARSNVEALERQIHDQCNANAALDSLESLQQDCQRMIKNPPTGISDSDRQRLQDHLRRLEAWIGFARARDVLAMIRGTGGMKREGEWVVIPDLSEVESDIKTAKKDPKAARAVRSRRLEATLRRLQGQDQQIAQEIQEVRDLDLLNTPTLDKAREAEQRIRRWVNQPSSHRTELLELQDLARSILREELLSKARELVDQAQSDYFANLDVASVEKILKEFDALGSDDFYPGGGESLHEIVKTPLAMAQAHRSEREARRNRALWVKAQRAWEEAARGAEEEEWKEYCERRARLAFKEAEFFRAEWDAPNPEAAEKIFRALCQDEALRDDWQVWFRHGSYCLRTLQDILRTPLEKRGSADPSHYLAASRESLGRARRLIYEHGEPPNDDLQRSLKELEIWEKLADAQRKIQRAFQADPLRVDACEEALQEYDHTAQDLKTNDQASRLLDEFWQDQITRARQKLEKQARRSTDSLSRVNAWLGIRVLFPGDRTSEEKLKQLGLEAWGTFQAKVKDAVFDPTAQSFLARYRGEKNINPDEREIVNLQINDVRALQRESQNLTGILDLVDLQSTVGGISEDQVKEVQQQLQDWEKQLLELRQALAQATQLAEMGLLDPTQFERAKYVLGQKKNAERTVGLVVVPPTFRDQAHPSYLACKTYLTRMETRRQDEERRRKKLDICLRYSQATTVEELRPLSDDDLEIEVLQELRQGLQKGKFPVEVALDIMQAMRRAEPDDACGLQEDIQYRDPDSTDPEPASSWDAVYNVIKAKVEQIQTIRTWLMQFINEGETPVGDCPGIIDWPTRSAQIQEWQEQGPQKLVEAIKMCRGILHGDGQGLYEGFWSLSRAYDELARERMIAYLQETTEQQDVIRLCTPARSLDRKREELRAEIGQQKQDCAAMEQRIAWKIRNYERRWNDFLTAFHDLMAKRKGIFRKRRKLYETSQWQAFERAAREFYKICSQDANFTDMLDQVRKETGLDVTFS